MKVQRILQKSCNILFFFVSGQRPKEINFCKLILNGYLSGTALFQMKMKDFHKIFINNGSKFGKNNFK